MYKICINSIYVDLVFVIWEYFRMLSMLWIGCYKGIFDCVMGEYLILMLTKSCYY